MSVTNLIERPFESKVAPDAGESWHASTPTYGGRAGQPIDRETCYVYFNTPEGTNGITISLVRKMDSFMLLRVSPDDTVTDESVWLQKLKYSSNYYFCNLTTASGSTRGKTETALANNSRSWMDCNCSSTERKSRNHEDRRGVKVCRWGYFDRYTPTRGLARSFLCVRLKLTRQRAGKDSKFP